MIKAIVYSTPRCHKCRLTAKHLARAGVTVEERNIHDYTEVYQALIEVGELTMPYVEIIDTSRGYNAVTPHLDSWHDFQADKIQHWEKQVAP